MSQSLVRAHLLIQQQRWDLAERELHLALAEDGENAEAHCLLAMCFQQKEQFEEATAETQRAIHLAPDDPRGHLVLGSILFSRRRYAEATAAAEEAIRLDPYQPHAFELLGRIAFTRGRWQEALAAAEQALLMDPEDTDCNNLRAMALVKLGRRDEAGRTIDAALTRDPEDSLTHANQGWTLLHSGQHKKAMEHFRESLRLEPNQEWARAGIIEAMKAKNIVYRQLLRYFFFMSRLSVRTQLILVFGLFFLQRVAGSISNNHPALAPFILPFLIAYLIFALLTWLGSPVCDLLLFSDKFGRLTLSSEQKLRALAVGALLLAGAATLTAAILLDDGLLLTAALCLALLAIPTSAITLCPEGWPRRTMLAATLALAAIGVLPLAVDVLARFNAITVEIGKTALNLNDDLFVWGILGSQFLANGLASVTVRR